jgi:DNA-binding IclR family transcriptional regulator
MRGPRHGSGQWPVLGGRKTVGAGEWNERSTREVGALTPSREYGLDSLSKAFAVLEALVSARAMGIQELVGATRLPKTTVFRLAHALEAEGYLERTDDGRYAIGLGFLKFAALFLGRNELRHAAAAPMRALRDRYGDTVNLGIFDGRQLIYLEILEGTQPYGMTARVGARVPLHATALGKAVAAWLPQEQIRQIVAADGFTAFTPRTAATLQDLNRQLAIVRRQGYAFDDQEMEPGFRCVAAAIRGREGDVVGGLSVSGPLHRLTDEVAPALGAEVREACESISRWLGHWPEA